MIVTNATALRRALQARDLLDSAATDMPAADTAHARPWYIAALLGASGYVAGAFTLAFVALLFRPDSAPAAALAGAILLAAAWGLYRADRDGVFVAQLALALSLAGQCLVLFALNEHARGIAPVAASALPLQIVLAAAMPNRLHRLLSALFATIAWALTVRFGLFGEPEFWRSGAYTVAPSLARALGGWLAAWLPLGALLWLLIRREPAWMARGWQAVLRPVTSGLIAGLAFATLASQPFESLRWFGGNGPQPPDWLALWPLLSALAALGGVAAAFALRSRPLIGACALAVLLHIAHFYYELGTSLLLKSLLLAAMGAALLLAARWLASKGERT